MRPSPGLHFAMKSGFPHGQGRPEDGKVEDPLDAFKQRLSAAVQDLLVCGFYTITIESEMKPDGTRRVVISAGRRDQFLIPESEIRR